MRYKARIPRPSELLSKLSKRYFGQYWEPAPLSVSWARIYARVDQPRSLYSAPCCESRPSFTTFKRHFSASSKWQVGDNNAEASEPQRIKRWRPSSTLIIILVLVSAGAGSIVAYLVFETDRDSPIGDVINKSTFSAFTITSKEKISPTAFVLAVRPRNTEDSSGVGDSSSSSPSARIREAWRHGLWSVEVKQPQLQIARHYTPLPAPSRLMDIGDDVQEDELRFLIRKMDGGEMSNYLSRLTVGDDVWLRGPHLGFDVTRRLVGVEGGRARAGREVVFLAGGTGVAPALQVAHKMLDDGNETGELAQKLRVSILWANRWSVDALGREEQQQPRQGYFWDRLSCWAGIRTTAAQSSKERLEEELGEMEQLQSSLERQILDMKKRHGTRFKISYFVDEERKFIGAQDLRLAFASTSSSATPSSTSVSWSTPQANSSPCVWHSAAALETLPDDNDAERRHIGCACAMSKDEKDRVKGKNLLFVSGPDGFVNAYAGPKRWYEGNEMQGSVKGLLGLIQKKRPGTTNEWLVLKL